MGLVERRASQAVGGRPALLYTVPRRVCCSLLISGGQCLHAALRHSSMGVFYNEVMAVGDGTGVVVVPEAYTHVATVIVTRRVASVLSFDAHRSD